MQIKFFEESDSKAWDDYVKKHSDAFHSHLIGWKYVIEQTYGKKSYYLIAKENDNIIGVLPLFHIKSILFGNKLVSIPYLTYGGVLADNEQIEEKMILESVELSKYLNASLELRHVRKFRNNKNFRGKLYCNDSKVSMRLDLPDSDEKLFSSFKSKLRSQIRRPQKEGMTLNIGGKELIDDFYHVFAINMRDLGSPVHSKTLFVNMFNYLNDTIKIGVVYFKKKPVSTGIIVTFNKYVEIPWASSLRTYNRYSPNMLLYWGFLKYVTNHSFKTFDFGRSTEGESTYRFKKQWGSYAVQLNWYSMDKTENEKNDFKKELFINIWARMPISLTSLFGPSLRKDISL